MSVLGDLIDLLTFWRREQRDADRALREAKADAREDLLLQAQQRQLSLKNQESLRDNLKYRVEVEDDPVLRNGLETELKAADETLTQILRDVALDDPRVRQYYAESMRALVPREIGPTTPLPEPVRETADLVLEASDSAGATPADAEGHFLRGNALYLRSERLEGTAILEALTQAVEAYDQALEVRTREALPQDWAMTLNNKGNALSVLGERGESEEAAKALTRAVDAFDQALEVYTRDALPQDWAMTLTNKGDTLRVLGQLSQGEPATRALTQAVDAFDQALEVRTRDGLPQYWAATLTNKGNALQELGNRMKGGPAAQALTRAVEAYDQALEVYTRDALPQYWATTLNNKGGALMTLGERMEGEEGTRALTQAVESYDQALAVRTRQTLPQDWASTLTNKGIALHRLGQRREGELGVQTLTRAIEVYDQGPGRLHRGPLLLSARIGHKESREGSTAAGADAASIAAIEAVSRWCPGYSFTANRASISR